MQHFLCFCSFLLHFELGKTALTAASNVPLRPCCVKAEHSLYPAAPILLANAIPKNMHKYFTLTLTKAENAETFTGCDNR